MEDEDYVKKYAQERNLTSLYFSLGIGIATLLFWGATKIEPLATIRERYLPYKVEIRDYNNDGIEDILIADSKGENHLFYGQKLITSEK